MSEASKVRYALSDAQHKVEEALQFVEEALSQANAYAACFSAELTPCLRSQVRDLQRRAHELGYAAERDWSMP
jgi:hypothetical protein